MICTQLCSNENVFLARQAVASFYSRGKNLVSAKLLLRTICNSRKRDALFTGMAKCNSCAVIPHH